jgi:ADP-ribose pyrophosphatase YjhB (NUDIX family)
MKRFLLKIWRILPFWVQRAASVVIRPHYQVAVGAVIFNEQRHLLLCEHTYRRIHPWGLPGGDLKYGEDPLDGIKREVHEETGLVIHNARLILVENSIEIHQITLTYSCTGVSGTFIPNDEVSGTRYFEPGRLPDLSQGHRATIEKCLTILSSKK